MFEQILYVPVLRWKGGEKRALRFLLPEDRARLTPLIEWPRPSEISHPDEKRPKSTPPDELARDILKHWCPRHFFCDMHQYLDGPLQRDMRALHRYVIALRDGGLRPVPVLTLADQPNYVAAVQPLIERHGVCLRMGYDEMIASDLAGRVSAFASSWNPARRDVHLVADFGAQRDAADISALCGRLPNLNQFRTFTVVAGAFPLDLREFRLPGTYRLPRAEWAKWRDYALNAPKRRPTFGDYATLHPALAPRKPGGLNPSASITYAVPDSWLVLKGESLHKEDGPGYAQYRGHSLLLTKHEEYAGSQFSFGDEYISQVAKGAPSTGNTTSWVCAGVNHHMTLVVRQIASLF